MDVSPMLHFRRLGEELLSMRIYDDFETVNKNNNQQVFYTLLKAGLWEKEVCFASYGDIDFSKVYQLAQEQSVIGMIATGLGQMNDVRIPQEVSLAIAGEVLQLEQRNKAMNAFIASLIDKMRSAGIYTLLVKGQGVAQCYENPLWRTCGDVDLFLNEDNYSKARELLLPLASEVDEELVGVKHLGMTIDNWIVELHGSLHVGLPKRINRVLDDIQKDTFYGGNVRSWDNKGVQIFMLGIENDIFYVFVHFLNHFYKGGIGLRQICDWCRLLWTYRDKLNLKLLETQIQKAGLQTEWKAFAAFVVGYLGMPVEAMPFYSSDNKWKRKAEKICSFIMEVGNFGHNRDMSFYNKYPYLIRKCCSMWMRVSDLINHAMIFPVNSLRFFPNIMFNGLKSAIRGEG